MILLSSPAVVLRQFLLDEGLVVLSGSTGDWWGFIESMPDGDPKSPTYSANCIDNVVCLYNRPSGKDGRLMRGGKVLDRFSVQIKVRATDPVGGWRQMAKICAFIDGVQNRSVQPANTKSNRGHQLDGTVYTIPSISRSGIIPMGMEPGTKRRFFYAVNCTMVCEDIADFASIDFSQTDFLTI